MKSCAFDESNMVLRPPEGAEDVTPLHVFHDREGNELISLWRMSWRERLSALVFGRAWVRVKTQNGEQPPFSVHAMRTVFRRKS
jgi:hypothetical protein